jgi:hypothetical protein
VFAPVARMEAVWLLLALMPQEGWQVHHMGVKMAFLNVNLQRRCMMSKHQDLLNLAKNTRYLNYIKLCMVYIKLFVPRIKNWMNNWEFWGS